MAEAGFWVVWGLPTTGREREALAALRDSIQYFHNLQRDGRIERSDVAVLRPQSTELGGFILLQGSRQQIDALRRDNDFQRWLNHSQLVADKFGVVDAWVNEGLSEAFELYEDALKRLD